MFQPGQEGVRGEELAAGGCQFDGEWQAIQTDTDLRDGTSSGAGHLERRFRGLGALEKEGDGGRVGEDLRSRKLCEVRERQGWDRKFMFALDMQGGATGDQELVHQKSFEQVQQGSRSALFDAKCLGDGGNNQVGVADGSERDKRDTVSEIVEHVGGDLEGEAGFADTAGAGEGHETHVWASQEGTSCCHLLLAADQRGELREQVVRRGACRLGWLSRRKYEELVLHNRLLPTTSCLLRQVSSDPSRSYQGCR